MGRRKQKSRRPMSLYVWWPAGQVQERPGYTSTGVERPRTGVACLCTSVSRSMGNGFIDAAVSAIVHLWSVARRI
eukprot:scaffold104685_cov33-Tisochrysis_lutea.AAC.1